MLATCICILIGLHWGWHGINYQENLRHCSKYPAKNNEIEIRKKRITVSKGILNYQFIIQLLICICVSSRRKYISEDYRMLWMNLQLCMLEGQV
jgi:hypothetical protein